MVNFSGRWIGRLQGNNIGNFILVLEHADNKVKGELRLNDVAFGLSTFDVDGIANNDIATFSLIPRETASGINLIPGSAKATYQADGSIAGSWETKGRTLGNFVAVREAQTQETHLKHATPSGAAATAISYEKKNRVQSCVVDDEGLKRLFRDLSIGADEAARLELTRRQQVADTDGSAQNAPTLESIRAFYSVTIMARGESGEQVITLDSQVLNTELLPKPLKSISLDIGPYYRLKTNMDALNRASCSLDFTKPPLMDLKNPSGSPTPNESTIDVFGNDSIWVAGVYEKLTSTLAQGRVRSGWLHSAHVYDFLLFIIGMPAALTLAASTSSRFFPGISLPYVIASFIFVMFAALMAFRLGFSFVRWLLPYIEFSRLNQPLHRQVRILIATITLGVLASLTAAVIWATLR